jgi:hypothetical protein
VAVIPEARAHREFRVIVVHRARADNILRMPVAVVQVDLDVVVIHCVVVLRVAERSDQVNQVGRTNSGAASGQQEQAATAVMLAEVAEATMVAPVADPIPMVQQVAAEAAT